MNKSSVIINRLSITVAGLIIDYLFTSDYPGLEYRNRGEQEKKTNDYATEKKKQANQPLSLGGWGWGRGNLGVIVVRVCEPVFQNLPHSYT